MKKEKPLIIITNDDGVEADGIVAIAKAFRSLGSVVVFAPDVPRSGMSCAITFTHPISYRLLIDKVYFKVYSCTGTPVDCVKLALNEVITEKPDLLISGINHGGNQGLSVHYSGTIGAAFEGCVFGIPSIAMSLSHYQPGADFSEACRLGIILAELVLQRGLPDGVYLNMNVPNIPKVKGIAVGRQSDGRWVREFLQDETDEKKSYWLAGDYVIKGQDSPDNDVTLLLEGYASLVPCKIDVTDYSFMEELKKYL